MNSLQQRPEVRLRGLLDEPGASGQAPAALTIRVNGDEREVPAGLSVTGLLEHLGLHPRMVVVERNGHILRREALAESPVEPGDTYELVHFVGGG